MAAKYEHWLLTMEGQIATLTLNRSEVNNTLTSQTLHELRDAIRDLRANKDVWVVVLNAAGEHFSTGFDVKLIAEMIEESEGSIREYLADQQRCVDEFEAFEKPVIAQLHGFCIGGGILLALCCDFRIASTRTLFSLPEVRLGFPVLWGTQRVERLVGPAIAKELILLGKRFNADQALSYGLVNKVVPPEELVSTTKALASEFLKLPPRTVGIAKQIINASYNASIRESEDQEIDALSKLLTSPDLREAVESYLEKRPPHFTGE
jgi:enoyl-CoA hydratase/carnithine racemase